MNIHQFLEHHGIVRNPFAEEDAQTDPVFKNHCIASTYHPTWELNSVETLQNCFVNSVAMDFLLYCVNLYKFLYYIYTFRHNNNATFLLKCNILCQ